MTAPQLEFSAAPPGWRQQLPTTHRAASIPDPSWRRRSGFGNSMPSLMEPGPPTREPDRKSWSIREGAQNDDTAIQGKCSLTASVGGGRAGVWPVAHADRSDHY